MKAKFAIIFHLLTLINSFIMGNPKNIFIGLSSFLHSQFHGIDQVHIAPETHSYTFSTHYLCVELKHGLPHL